MPKTLRKLLNCNITRTLYHKQLVYAISVVLSLAAIPSAQAESQHLGSLIPKTDHGAEEFGEGKLFDGLIVQGNWSWKVGRDPGTPESYRWNDPDYEMTFGTDRNMNLKYQGIWYPAQSRDWHTPEVIKEELEKYTRALFERYYVERGQKIDVLRVINEIGADINRRPELEAGLLEEGQVDETGLDWLINLFAMVRSIADEYDPDVQLFINDYGLLGGGVIKRARLVEIINTVNNAEGGPYIDALGCQGHGIERASGDGIKNQLNFFAENLDHDVDIYVTEYDVNTSNDEDQRAIYMRQFPVMWEHPSVTSMALWGFEEGFMWSVKAQAYLVRADGTDRSAMTWLRAYMKSKNTAPVTSFNLPSVDNLPVGTDVEVQIQANDRDGVTKVDFYLNDVFVGSETKTYDMDGYGEHDFLVSNLAEGEHTLKAIAYDTNGLTTTVEKTISMVTLEPPTEPADVILYAEADAYVRSGNFANRNFGNANLIAQNGSGKSARYDSYLRFDVSSLPSNVESVWLELNVSSVKEGGAEARASFVSDDSWSENSITYNTRPAASNTLSTVDGITGAGSVKFFMGNKATEESAGDGKLSLMVDELSGKLTIAFRSSEYADDPTLRPRLLVYLDSTPPPPYTGGLPVSDGLVLHLDASTLTDRNEGDEVLEWPNLVPGGRNATTSNDIAPLFAEGFFNGRDALRFDGIDDWMDIGTMQSETGDIEVLIVTQAPASGGTYQRIIAGYNTGGNDWTAPNWIMLRDQDSNGNPQVMTPQLIINPKSNVALTGVKLGRNGMSSQNFFEGDIAEVAIFNRRLKAWERNEVAYYLEQKYYIDSFSYLDPESDPDGDGANTRSELIAGTLPDNPSSVLKLKLNRIKNQHQVDNKGITWQSVSNRQYLIERSFDLVVWHDYMTIQGNGSEIEVIDVDDHAKAFYKIIVSEE